MIFKEFGRVWIRFYVDDDDDERKFDVPISKKEFEQLKNDFYSLKYEDVKCYSEIKDKK